MEEKKFSDNAYGEPARNRFLARSVSTTVLWLTGTVFIGEALHAKVQDFRKKAEITMGNGQVLKENSGRILPYVAGATGAWAAMAAAARIVQSRRREQDSD